MPDYTLARFGGDVFRHGFLFVQFTLGPLLVLAALYWACAKIFADTFFGEAWLQPAVFMGAMFLSGVFSRMLSEGFVRSMGLFVAAILGFGAFGCLCAYDLQHNGGLFSNRLLPEPFRFSLEPYLYLAPPTGLLGMLCFKWFTLRP